MAIYRKRIYEPADDHDGYRVLVDRLWPRGLGKDRARLDAWCKEIAPSDELRKWFHANSACWGEFRRRYLAELKGHREELRELCQRAQSGRVTLLYASRDFDHNQAVVIQQYLKMLQRGQ